MAFYALQVEAVEGLSTWRGREREIGEGEINNSHVMKVTFYRVFLRDVIKFLNPKLKSHRCFYPH